MKHTFKLPKVLDYEYQLYDSPSHGSGLENLYRGTEISGAQF